MPTPTKRTNRRTGRPEDALRAAVEPVPTHLADYLITIADGGEADAAAFLEESGGMQSMASTAALSADQLGVDILPQPGSGTYLARLGIAVAKLDEDHYHRLADVTSGHDAILAIEPAPIFYTATSWDQAAYLRGYADGVNGLVAALSGPNPSSAQLVEERLPTGRSTWGLRATRADVSRASGRGVRIAILDTGLDLRHPDFAGRSIISRSFIVGEDVQDGHGHGTHCAGTACGPRQPQQGPRYGIAYEAELFVGKVLGNSGGSRGRSVELGMEWALANRCDIISMSLGSPVLPGEAPIQAYERIGSRALMAGMLFVAAAGNESVRSRGLINPVGSPANVPSILAVAAIDESMAVADFSNGAVNGAGGEINLAGPGVGVHSCVPGGYGLKSGTSMAAPHVAGLAALHAEATTLRGAELWQSLTAAARSLPFNRSDVGDGLVQALT